MFYALLVQPRKTGIQGNRILTTEEGEEVGVVPGGHQPFGLEADFGRGVVPQEIGRDLPDHRQIFHRVPVTDPALILSAANRV